MQCLSWCNDSTENSLLQTAGICNATDISFDEMEKKTQLLYKDNSFSAEQIRACSLENPEFLFCEHAPLISVSSFSMTPCSLCPYSDSFKNARIEKERNLLYALFDGTLSVGNFKENKTSNVFKSELLISDETGLGKWPIVPFYNMLYKAYQFAYITMEQLSIGDAERLFFNGNNQMIPLLAQACEKNIPEIEAAFSSKLKEFIENYVSLSPKAAFSLLSELETPYKRACSSYRNEHNIQRLHVRKRTLKKTNSEKNGKTSGTDIPNNSTLKEAPVGVQLELFPKSLLEEMTSSLGVSEDDLLSEQTIFSTKNEKSNVSDFESLDALYSKETVPTNSVSKENIEKMRTDNVKKSDISNLKKSDNLSYEKENISFFSPVYQLIILDKKDIKDRKIRLLSPLNVPGFEILAHKEKVVCLELVVYKKQISLLLFMPLCEKYYLISPDRILGSVSFLLKNISCIYTLNSSQVLFFLHDHSVKCSNRFIDIGILSDILDTKNTSTETCLGLFPETQKQCVSFITDYMKSYYTAVQDLIKREHEVFSCPEFLCFNSLMQVFSYTFFYDKENASYTSLVYKSGNCMYKFKDYKNTLCEFKNKIFIWCEDIPDATFYYYKCLNILYQKSLFSAYGGHLLNVNDSGFLLSFDFGEKEDFIDLLWSICSGIFYRCYSDQVLSLHIDDMD